MNYIKQLQADRDVYKRAFEALQAGLMDLSGYLTSAKFHNDTTVQAQDVLNRMAEINSAARAIAYEASE